jgi:GNAT superfamily N-acetyltransferase
LATEPLIIRRAKADDVPQVVALLLEDASRVLDEAAPGDLLYQRAFAAIDSDPNQLLLVGSIGAVTIATLQLTFIPYLMHRGRPTCLIEAVRVSRSLRSLGIGAKLIHAAIAAAKDRGCARVQLTTHKQRLDAHRFYERLGFTASHEGMKLPL